MSAPVISRADREDLQRLVRQREKALKSAVKQQKAEVLADFENQMGQEYSFDQDEVWRQAAEAAETEVRKTQEKVAARCAALGIPKGFAPSLNLHWAARGYNNSVDKRKAELRRMAQTQAEANERRGITQVEMNSVDAQTKLAVAGLSSDAARALFDECFPSIDSLMPRLSFAELAGEANPPIAEQLVSPNALRQRRFREKHGVTAALQGPGVTPKEDAES